jgi:hypothetical protein
MIAVYYLFVLAAICSCQLTLPTRPDDVKWTSSTRLADWYQPWELCVLNATSPAIGKKDLLTKCTNDYGKDKDHVWGFHCRAGGAYHGNACWQMDPSQHTFQQREYLRRAVQGYDDPGRSYLHEAIVSVAKQKAALLMIGDSLMAQFGVACTCELRRLGLTIDKRNWWDTDFPSPSIQLKEPVASVPSLVVRTDIFARGNTIEPVLRARIREFLNISERVFVLISGGAHSNHRAVMEATALRTLRLLHTISVENPNVVFIYFETPATHFNTSNGYWNYSHTACVPLQDPSPAADWRNLLVRKHIAEHNLTSIRMVYLRKLTEPLYREHVLGNFKDCTHYCWSPMMYQYVFAQVAQIIESVGETLPPAHGHEKPKVAYPPLKAVSGVITWQQFVGV